jgi:hypothetical protein
MITRESDEGISPPGSTAAGWPNAEEHPSQRRSF